MNGNEVRGKATQGTSAREMAKALDADTIELERATGYLDLEPILADSGKVIYKPGVLQCYLVCSQTKMYIVELEAIKEKQYEDTLEENMKKQVCLALFGTLYTKRLTIV